MITKKVNIILLTLSFLIKVSDSNSKAATQKNHALNEIYKKLILPSQSVDLTEPPNFFDSPLKSWTLWTTLKPLLTKPYAYSYVSRTYSTLATWDIGTNYKFVTPSLPPVPRYSNSYFKINKMNPRQYFTYTTESSTIDEDMIVSYWNQFTLGKGDILSTSKGTTSWTSYNPIQAWVDEQRTKMATFRREGLEQQDMRTSTVSISKPLVKEQEVPIKECNCIY